MAKSRTRLFAELTQHIIQDDDGDIVKIETPSSGTDAQLLEVQTLRAGANNDAATDFRIVADNREVTIDVGDDAMNEVTLSAGAIGSKSWVYLNGNTGIVSINATEALNLLGVPVRITGALTVNSATTFNSTISVSGAATLPDANITDADIDDANITDAEITNLTTTDTTNLKGTVNVGVDSTDIVTVDGANFILSTSTSRINAPVSFYNNCYLQTSGHNFTVRNGASIHLDDGGKFTIGGQTHTTSKQFTIKNVSGTVVFSGYLLD